MFLRLKPSRRRWLLIEAVVAGDSSVPVEVQVLDADANVLLVVLFVVGEFGEVDLSLHEEGVDASAADKAVDSSVEGDGFAELHVEAGGEDGKAGHEGRTRGASGESR